MSGTVVQFGSGEEKKHVSFKDEIIVYDIPFFDESRCGSFWIVDRARFESRVKKLEDILCFRRQRCIKKLNEAR